VLLLLEHPPVTPKPPFIEINRPECIAKTLPDLVVNCNGHPQVMSVGNSGSDEDLQLEEKSLEKMGFDVQRSDRGGQDTHFFRV